MLTWCRIMGQIEGPDSDVGKLVLLRLDSVLQGAEILCCKGRQV